MRLESRSQTSRIVTTSNGDSIDTVRFRSDVPLSLLSTFMACISLHNAFVHVAAAQPPTPTVSHKPPVDVDIPPDFQGDPVAFFDDFSWRSFIALNWPALEGRRGEPDPNKELGDAATNVVWGTWKADHEVFQPGGMEPSVWEEFRAQSPDRFASFLDAGRTKVLGGFGLRGSELQIEHYYQANAAGLPQGALASRNRQYVRYEVRINRTEFDFIRSNRLYLGRALDAEIARNGQVVFPEGAVEIKAAWRLFVGDELSDRSMLDRYYRTSAVLIDPDGSRQEALVGLIGLHIVSRTPSRREWIWSTFEHVDNDIGSTSTLVVSQDANTNNWNRLHPPVAQGEVPRPDPDPVQVRRLRPDTRLETASANAAYHSHDRIKTSVWKNYRLVMTQWPRTPAVSKEEFIANFRKGYPVGAGNPSPLEQSGFPIANLTMETTSKFQSEISCMQCHFNAGRQQKTEFVWTVPLRTFRGDPVESARALRALRDNLETMMRETGGN